MNAFQTEIETRKTYETAKNAANDSIIDVLDKLSKLAAIDAVANVLTACNVDSAFINRQERVNARFNVYSAEKVFNTALAISQDAITQRTLNHYSLAIVRAALALEASDSMLTHSDAVAACSLDVKHKDSKRAALIKTTRYQKHVAANTATTQASSSLNALQCLSVFTESRDASNATTYKLNREIDATQRLIALATQ